jgi:hypothetical protein
MGVYRFDICTDRASQFVPPQKGMTYAPCISVSGDRVAAIVINRTTCRLGVWDTDTGSTIASFDVAHVTPEGGGVGVLTFLNSENKIVVADFNGRCTVWDVAKGAAIGSFGSCGRSGENYSPRVAFSHNRSICAIGGRGHFVIIDAQDGSCISTKSISGYVKGILEQEHTITVLTQDVGSDTVMAYEGADEVPRVFAIPSEISGFRQYWIAD